MIQSEWFDEQYTSTMYGDITITYSLHGITDARLADAGFNPMKAYAVGSIPAKYAKIIAGKHVTAPITNDYVIDTTDPTAVIKSTATTSKAFWGFGAWNPNYPQTPCYFNQTFGRWGQSGVTYNQSPQFIQEMKAYGLRYIEPKISVQFKIVDTHTETTPQNNTITTCYANGDVDFGSVMTISLSQLRNFIENDTPISVTDANLGTKSLKFSDMIDNKFWLTGTNQYMYAEVYGQNYPQSYYKNNTQNTNIVPLASTMCGDDIILEFPFYRLFESTQIALSDADGNGMSHIVYWTQGIYNGAANEYQSSSDWGYIGKDNSNFWGDPNEYELPVDTLAWLNPQPSGVKVYDFQNGLVWCYSGGYMSVGGRNLWKYMTRRVVDFDVLYFYFGMFNRCIDPDDSTAPTDRYVTGDYISIYQNNIPKPEFIVYDGNYDPIVPRLMEWQQYGHDISEDDYKPEEPQPEPSGDTPGDEPQNLPHDDGDPPELQKNRVIGVPSNFITQYALTSAELTTIGSNLWQTWLTPNTDVWKNFFLPYAQDFGTLNIGAALDFIVSLKVFPFEFTIDYYTQANGVRMGTGHTDFLGSSAPVVKSQIICVSAGSVKIELPNPYNDFRDMYNCSALCFMPYCGTVELNLQEILGRTLKAFYFIDCQSGGCTCVIECEGDAGDYVISSKTGQIGFTIPMTATNAGQLAAQAMSDATKAIGTLSGFFFDAGKTIGNNLTSAISAQLGKKTGVSEKGEVSLLSGNTFETSTKLGQSAVNTGLSLANQAIDMMSRSAVEMPMLSGGGSAESFMFADCVSIQIRRGRYKKPDNYPHSVGHYNLSSHPISYFKGAFTGSPSTGSNTGKGFCTFVGIDTSGLDCRDDERAEIISLLESGVYL